MIANYKWVTLIICAMVYRYVTLQLEKKKEEEDKVATESSHSKHEGHGLRHRDSGSAFWCR